MAGNRDFIEIVREIRGSVAPGQPLTDGIWYELTMADKNGNAGVYGDILAKYGVVTESAGTFDQAVAILENLNVEVSTLPAGSQATSALVNGAWQIGIPKGTDGVNGNDGFTPVVGIGYNAGNLNYTVTVDGVQVVNSVLLNLDTLVNTKVSTNVNVQTTLAAKQEVIDAVADSQGLVDSLDASVVTKKQEIATYTSGKIVELDNASANEQLEIGVYADNRVSEYNVNTVTKTNQYDLNHTTKLAAYNLNDTTKLGQYNDNHVTRLTDLNEAYAKRIVDMLETNKLLGAVDQFVVTVTTQQAKFISTVGPRLMYYVNGVQLVETADYTVYDNTTIDLVNPVYPSDVVIQIAADLLKDLMIELGQVMWEDVGVVNGVASLDGSGKVPSAQLPSYVDDVLEYATKAELPITGEQGKIYIVVVDETSGSNTSTYRWTGTVYAMVSNTLTASDVKSLYEANANTNAFTDADVTNLAANTLARHTHANKALLDVINQGLSTTSNIEFGSVKLAGGAGTEGTMSWNPDDMTMDLALINGVTLQVGQEANRLVKNGSAVTIPNGRVVMYTGSVGNSGKLTVQLSTGLFDGASTVYGVATQDILAGENGYVTVDGKIRGIDTTGVTEGETWADGAVLYVKPNDSGRMTIVEPLSNQLKMSVAKVIKAHSSGTLEIRIGSVINENQTATRATVLDTPRAIQLSGAVTGTADFDGSAAINIVTTHTADPVITLTGAVTGTGMMTNLGNVSIATTNTADPVITLAGDATGSVTLANLSSGTLTVSVVDDSHNHVIGNVDNLQATLDAKVDDIEKGSANGVATLDANGKVPLIQIADSILGQLEYQGVYNFTTMPVATEKGQYWIVSVAGNGYNIGDWAVYNGSTFDKVDNTDAVSSVSGRTGNVVLTKSDITDFGEYQTIGMAELKQYLTTGFISGLELIINSVDNTKVDILPGVFLITDYSSPLDPVPTSFTYAGLTGITPTYLASANATYFALDVNGTVIQRSSPFTTADRRNYCTVGAAIHSNRTTINVVNEIKAPIVGDTNQLHDLMKIIGSLNVEGNVYSPGATTLTLNKSGGTVFGLGINAHDVSNPHQLSIASQTGLTFRYRLRDGTEYSDITLVNPSSWDNNGVLTTVDNNKFTVQHINLFQSGITRIQYGQKQYANMEDAKAFAAVDAFVTEQNIAENSVFRCYLIMQKGITNLATAVSSGVAHFVLVDKFGSVVGGAASVLTFASLVATLGYTPANVVDLTTHTSNVSNPHVVTKAQVGLGSADNTADSNKNVLSATKLSTARTLNGVVFDGTADIVIPNSTTIIEW